ncbi:MAG: two-component regulator propeller domain-containing protein, partial [Ignavibacteria bacterium]|nr:two-component regulator propeller domain-containing protein [Ignavibacteria bacterium]
MDKKPGTFTRYMHDPENINSLTNNKIGAIYEDPQGILWIGAAKNEICKMDMKNETIERMLYSASSSGIQNSLPMNSNFAGYEHITFITQDNAGNYWIGTTESGIFFANPGFGKTPKYGKEFDTLQKFTDRGVWNSYTSRDGIFWMGSIEGNIYRFNPSPQKIPHFNTPSAAFSFYEAPNGDLWIATEHKIIRREPNNGNSKQTEVDLTPENFDNFQTICEDSKGNIWIGGNEGLAIWDKMKEKYSFLYNDPKNKSSLSNNSVITIYEDKQKNIWVGTTDGLNLLNQKNGDFKKYYMNQVDTSFIGLNVITAVLQNKSDQYWVGTWNGGGVYAFDSKKNKSKNYLSGTSIVCLYEDSQNVMWLGSNYGLFRYDPEIDNFVRYIDPFQVNSISFVY